ncbi:hypothetical protein H9Q70_012482 [Fusarium xylarioides]|nr:hypothetical protein H9Q70_012482 [Fusarium xylarioides]
MDTPGCDNLLTFHCKVSAKAIPFAWMLSHRCATLETKIKSRSESSLAGHSQNDIAGAPRSPLGLWRLMQVSSQYEDGLTNWGFTSDGQALLKWPNHPERGMESDSVSHSREYPSQYTPKPCSTVQLETRRCNGPWDAVIRECRYSCSAENDDCGAGSCDPADSSSVGALPPPNEHRWCTPEDTSCWPTKTAIQNNYPAPQPAPVPTGSVNNQGLYGLGSKGLRALYRYENIDEMQRPCFHIKDGVNIWNTASNMCKAALHQNEYRNWNPFIVVFLPNQRHIAAALKFAAQHRLCIATAGTGHEYNSRNSCPTGGMLIRTILLKNKEFLPTRDEDPASAPAGAFRFGAEPIFAEVHAFSAKYDRVVASGWCYTVGMTGYHLGGHGPFAPSMGLGVDNVLEIEVLKVSRNPHGQTVVHRKIVSRQKSPQLFWALHAGGIGVWGVILSMTLRCA